MFSPNAPPPSSEGPPPSSRPAPPSLPPPPSCGGPMEASTVPPIERWADTVQAANRGSTVDVTLVALQTFNELKSDDECSWFLDYLEETLEIPCTPGFPLDNATAYYVLMLTSPPATPPSTVSRNVSLMELGSQKGDVRTEFIPLVIMAGIARKCGRMAEFVTEFKGSVLQLYSALHPPHKRAAKISAWAERRRERAESRRHSGQPQRDQLPRDRSNSSSIILPMMTDDVEPLGDGSLAGAPTSGPPSAAGSRSAAHTPMGGRSRRSFRSPSDCPTPPLDESGHDGYAALVALLELFTGLCPPRSHVLLDYAALACHLPVPLSTVPVPVAKVFPMLQHIMTDLDKGWEANPLPPPQPTFPKGVFDSDVPGTPRPSRRSVPPELSPRRLSGTSSGNGGRNPTPPEQELLPVFTTTTAVPVHGASDAAAELARMRARLRVDTDLLDNPHKRRDDGQPIDSTLQRCGACCSIM